MAKAKEAPAKAKSKKVREKKDSYLKDNYVQINDENGIITEVMHVRGIGCIVRERSSTLNSMTSTFIPGVKVKTKKDWKYLIIDNGPKKKKNKGSEEEDDDE